jgi:hypothetical protein
VVFESLGRMGEGGRGLFLLLLLFFQFNF